MRSKLDASSMCIFDEKGSPGWDDLGNRGFFVDGNGQGKEMESTGKVTDLTHSGCLLHKPQNWTDGQLLRGRYPIVEEASRFNASICQAKNI